MPLEPHQIFIKNNFTHHARATAHLTASIGLPETQAEYELKLYIACMCILSTAFKENKIIVKSQPEWDKLEEDSL